MTKQGVPAARKKGVSREKWATVVTILAPFVRECVEEIERQYAHLTEETVMGVTTLKEGAVRAKVLAVLRCYNVRPSDTQLRDLFPKAPK